MWVNWKRACPRSEHWLAESHSSRRGGRGRCPGPRPLRGSCKRNSIPSTTRRFWTLLHVGGTQGEQTQALEKLKLLFFRDFPGGPVVKTLRSQCRGIQVPSLVGELKIPWTMWCGWKQNNSNKVGNSVGPCYWNMHLEGLVSVSWWTAKWCCSLLCWGSGEEEQDVGVCFCPWGSTWSVWYLPAGLSFWWSTLQGHFRSSCEAKCFGVIRRGSLYQGNQFRMTLMGLGVKLQSSPMTKRI